MSFSSDYASIEWENIDIVFVCVQTPNNIETNSVDTKFLESAIKEINNVIMMISNNCKIDNSSIRDRKGM